MSGRSGKVAENFFVKFFLLLLKVGNRLSGDLIAQILRGNSGKRYL